MAGWQRLRGLFEWHLFEVLIRHASGTVFALILFWGVGLVVKHFVSDNATRIRIEGVENFVLLCLMWLLAIQLGVVLLRHLWKEVKSDWNGPQFLAI
jgi:hypothetical protein